VFSVSANNHQAIKRITFIKRTKTVTEAKLSIYEIEQLIEISTDSSLNFDFKASDYLLDRCQ
jgi:nitrogen regulatory protein PII